MQHPPEENPGPEAAYRAARALHEAGDLDSARITYLHALRIHPHPSAIYHDLGVLLRAMGHAEAAIAFCHRALAAEPEDADTWSNLGNALFEIGDPHGALAAYSEALRLGPETPLAHKNVGWCHFSSRAFAEAVGSFARALALDPEDADARLHLGLSQLHLGRYREGFAAYEARTGRIFDAEGAVAPVWDGSALKGRHLLVQAEQGLGDILQFSRFLIPLAEQADGPVSCEVPTPLLRLFQASFPGLTFFEQGTPAPEHHFFVPIGSLPARLGVDAARLVPRMPYLSTGTLEASLPQTGQLKVGLTWSGNRSKLDRSCPFDAFMALLGVDGIDFYSFQRGDPAEDIKTHGAEGLVTDLGSRLTDFADDATYVRQLDLVISVDTSFCHLAGALGVPCWVLLTHRADWRYLSDGQTTPWYPSFQLFRGKRGDGWAPVISEAREKLRHWADARR